MKIIFTSRKCPYKSVTVTDRTMEKILWNGLMSLNIYDDFEDVEMRVEDVGRKEDAGGKVQAKDV